MGEMPHLPQNKNRKKTRKNSSNHGKQARSDWPSLVANLQQIFSFLQFLQKQLHAEKNYSKSKLSTPILFTFFCYTPKKKKTIINLCNNIQSFQNLGIYQFKQFPEDQVLLSPPPSKNCRRKKRET